MTKEDSNFEFNDGLGDLLKDNPKHQFSYTKTFLVIFLFLTASVSIVYFMTKTNTNVAKKPQEIIKNTSIEKKPTSISKKQFSSKPITAKKTELSKINHTKNKNNKVENLISKKELIKEIKSASKTNFHLLAGAFLSKENAKKRQSELSKHNINSIIATKQKNNKTLYVIQIGIFKSKTEAEKQQSLLTQHKIENIIIQR